MSGACAARYLPMFSSDITAIWGEEFNRWEHFPAFMGVLLGLLAGPPPGLGAEEAVVAGAVAGAALPFVLDMVKSRSCTS